MKKRNIYIDILKGIGICLIVLGHTDFFGTRFIYLFHVAIFIIASGYFFNSSKSKTFKDFFQYTKKKIKKLYIPYIVVNIIGVLLNNFLLNHNMYSLGLNAYYNFSGFLKGIIKVFCFRGVTELFGATWFLHLLFLITVSYYFMSFLYNNYFTKIIRKELLFQLIISIIFLLGGWLLSTLNLNGFFNIYIIFLNTYWLYYFGNLLKSKERIINRIDIKKGMIIVVVTFLLLLLLNKVGNIEISKNLYTNPPFFVACSILGWFFVYGLSVIISKIKLNKIIMYIGEKSLYVLLFHLMFFKLINLLICIYKGDPKSMVSKFPVAYNGYYSLLYFVGGIILSLLLAIIINYLKSKIKIKEDKK